MTIKPEHFAHLHAHSAYSLKDGSIPIRTLVDRQVENGSCAVACTDHGNMSSSWFLYDYINNVKKYDDVRPILGCELYLSETRDELFEWLPTAKETHPDKEERAAIRKRLAKKYHQIILCKNKTGYFNAVKIHNDAWKNGFYYSPATTKEVIFEHHEGIIATTTCLASLWCQKIMSGEIDAARKEIELWKSVFGDDFFVELQPTNNKTQALVNVELIRLARQTNTPMIVTNDVHYIDYEDHELHFTLLNLEKLKKDPSKDQDMWEFGVDDLYIKSLDEMKQSWKDHHKSKVFTESVFEECVHSVAEIISRVENFSLESSPLLPQVTDEEPIDKLKRDVVNGFREKVKKGAVPASRMNEYQERLAEELSVIHALGAENYINICAKITDWCKVQNIARGPGRGSAGASLVLWCLGVTDVDAIRHNLIFSRFLNRNRRPKLKM